tara:strand:- start:746 stop:1372 length:627 start_codon:yes stop_codon:yes gene_type:complete
MNKNLVIIGKGNHSKVVLEMIKEKKNLKLILHIDGKNLNKLKEIYKKTRKKLYCHIAIGSNYVRGKTYRKLIKHFPRIKFISLKSKKSIISKITSIGEGSLVMPGVIINTHSQIGKNCIINTGSIIEHDNFFGDFTSCGPGVVTGGNVKVEKFSHLGIGSVILNDCKIGLNTIIGANSTVTRNCEKNCTYIGSPAKKIKSRKPGDTYL